MADEPLEKPVFDHAGVAMLTPDLLSARPAQRDRRIAAPVEEQQRLLTARDPALHGGGEAGRDPAPRLHPFTAHVDGMHCGQGRRAEPRVQIDAVVFAGIRIGPAFQRRRGRGQHHPSARDGGAQHRHIPRIVKRAILLLVRGVVFLIHHDQPKVAKRQEQRGARADHQLRLSPADHLPRPAAFGHRDARVPFHGLRAEPLLDPHEELLGQRNLGQQHQRLPSGGEAGGHRFEVNLGLARPGDAAKQGRGVAPLRIARSEARGGLGLTVGQRLAAPVGVHPWVGRVAGRLLLAHRAVLHQPLDDRRGHAGHLAQLFQGEGQPAIFLQHRQHPATGVCHPLRLLLA